uniref:Uncharacterized protein n=1 Tax=Arundo donax TaxID=35708 RepID=A0A0A9FNE8_ARUDO
MLPTSNDVSSAFGTRPSSKSLLSLSGETTLEEESVPWTETSLGS